MGKRKTQMEIFRPEPVVVKIFGDQYRLHLLTRGDVLDIIQSLIKSGFSNAKGIAGISGENIVSAIGGCEAALSIALERSFPEFQEWDEVPIASQIDLLSLIWESNDGPGIVANFSRMAQTVAE